MITAERPTILPPNASGLMRAVDRAVPQWDTLAPLRGQRYGHPTALDNHLAAEWALADFARYFDSTDALIAAGLPWLLERGTAAAVQRALAWVGFPAARLDEDGPWLHIDMGRAATNAELAQIAHVVRASVPAHVLFYRVYWAWDLRPIWLDARPMLDTGILDDESGTTIDLPDGQDPIKASFGSRHASRVARPRTTTVRLRLSACLREPVERLDVVRLDAWALDGPVNPLAITATVTHHLGHAAAHTRIAPHARRVPTLRAHAPGRAAAAATLRGQSVTRSATVRPIAPPRGWTGGWDAERWGASAFHTQVTTEPV